MPSLCVVFLFLLYATVRKSLKKNRFVNRVNSIIRAHFGFTGSFVTPYVV